MDRDAAREAAVRAKAHRERPRCPRCYSTDLKPSAHVCLKCAMVSSDVDAVLAGQALVDHGDGLYTHRDTGEVIVPGIPVEDIDRDTTLTYDDTDPANAQDQRQYRNVGTTVRLEHEYRNVVSREISRANGDEQHADMKPCPGGCGVLQENGWTCMTCREGTTGRAAATGARGV